jgi:glycosyl transferase family 25
MQHTLYINLKSRTDRLEHVQQELASMGIHDAVRINAVKTDPGSVGCTLSHIRALKHAEKEDWDSVFVCEDDIAFLNPELLKRNLEAFLKKDMEWDVLIIGGNNSPPYDIIDEISCRVYNCQTTTGYIVKKHYYRVMIENFKESVQLLNKNPTLHQLYALDIYWKKMQKKDKWFMILPLTVTQYQNYSDIEMRTTQYDWLMLDMEKKWIATLPPSSLTLKK